MGFKTYDAKQVVVSYAGFTLSGFAEGTKVTVEYDEDAWTKQVGVDGEVTRSKSNNRAGRVTVQLMQSSDSNQILSSLAEADRLSNAGAVPLMIKDNSGNSLHTAENAWIMKIPSAEYGVEAGPREWVFDCGTIVSNIGGN